MRIQWSSSESRSCADPSRKCILWIVWASRVTKHTERRKFTFIHLLTRHRDSTNWSTHSDSTYEKLCASSCYGATTAIYYIVTLCPHLPRTNKNGFIFIYTRLFSLLSTDFLSSLVHLHVAIVTNCHPSAVARRFWCCFKLKRANELRGQISSSYFLILIVRIRLWASCICLGDSNWGPGEIKARKGGGGGDCVREWMGDTVAKAESDAKRSSAQSHRATIQWDTTI